MIFTFFTKRILPRKYDPAIKKSKVNFVVEYPIWVSIKRTLTGKLAACGWNSRSFKFKFMIFTYGVWPRKYDPAIKKSKFNFVVEYPIWVSIKRTLTGKLAVGGRNFIYCAQFEENV